MERPKNISSFEILNVYSNIRVKIERFHPPMKDTQCYRRQKFTQVRTLNPKYVGFGGAHLPQECNVYKNN